MQFLENIYFFQSYSLQAVIIAVIVALITLLIIRFLGDKLSAVLLSFIPFAIGILLNFIYMVIAVGIRKIVVADLISAGVLCGSLSSVITAFIKRIKSGNKNELNALTLLLEHTLLEHLKPESASIAIMEIKNVAVSGLTKKVDTTTIETGVYELLEKYKKPTLSSEQTLALAKLTVAAVQPIIVIK